jgi:Putative Ig domain/Bacterial Ig domain
MPKPITSIQRWRLAAITIGSALAMALASTASAAKPNLNANNDATGTVGVPFSYTIQATNPPILSYGASPLPAGLSVNTATGSISGTPTTAGATGVTLSARNADGTTNKVVTFTINPPPTPTPPPHSAPTSIATISPPAVWEGDTVTLDGTQSHTNPSGGALVYQWQQQAPASPVLTLSPDNKTVVVTFIAPTVPLPALTQAVTFKLKVTDNLVSGGDKNTMSDAVTTTVYASPGADAEPKDAHVNEGALVTLNGSATRVQPGATLSYTWTAPAGITFSDTNTQNSNLQNPTFTAPLVGVAGTTLTFTLVVTEQVAGLANAKNSAPDSVTINVDNVNAPPTAQASAVDENDLAYPKEMAEVPENTDPVTLYGFGSDPDGDAISFTWTQVHDTTGSGLLPDDTVVFLSDNTAASPIFTAPNLTTQDHVDLVFQLTTYDGHLNSGPSYVTIRVNNTNNPPVAVPAVSPLSALEGDLVTLDGSDSYDPNNTPDDPNHDILTYTWVQTGTPAVTLTPTGSNATFIAPAVSNQQGSITLTFNLTVDDGNGGTDTKPVSITVSHRNLPPLAIASATGTVPEGETALLDGSTSWDPEGDSLTFSWVQLDGPNVGTLTPVTPDNKQMSFVAPDVGAGGGVAHFKLTVSDGHNPPSTATVEVNITYVNQPPTANAGNEQTVNEGDTVNLSGSGSDPDSNPLTFTWSYVSGLAIILNVDPSDSSKATFLAPQVFCAGDIVVMRLKVDDGFGGIATQDVSINVANANHAPTADAGWNQTNISEGGAVELHGTGDDADTEEASGLTFEWTQVPQIGEPAVTLIPIDGSDKDVGFTAPTIGGGDPSAFVDLHFSLTVMDSCRGSTTTDPITVHVANIPHAPVAVAQGPTTANEGGDNVQLDGSGSTDPDFDSLTYTWEQTAGPAVTLVYSPGDTGHVMPMFVTPWVSAHTDVKFKLTVSDFPGSTSSAYVTVKILNWNQPPDVTNAHADVPVLWPPDHKMIQVHILGVTDAQNNASITINSVTQDERTNGLGDGDTPVDAVIGGDSVLLRAERSGQGNGRVYKVCFTAADPERSVNGCFNVMVPKSKKTDVAIDSGGNYDSTH